MMPEFFSKLTLLLILGGIAAHVVRVWLIGRKLAKGHDPYLLSSHRSTVACMGCLTVIAVVIIEAMVRMSPHPYAVNGILLVSHLFIDGLLLLVGMIIICRFTGLQDPRWHKRLAYAMFTLLGLSAATGLPMLYALPL